MSDIDRAKQLFETAGLGFPTIPNELESSVQCQGEWLFATRHVDTDPYELHDYVREVTEAPVKDYALLCHSGHGFNSYAIQYYLVHGVLALFLHHGWGGVYMDNREEANRIRQCFMLADKIDLAAQAAHKLRSCDRLIVVASNFYGSYWSRLPEGKLTMDDKSICAPEDTLIEVLTWLTIP